MENSMGKYGKLKTGLQISWKIVSRLERNTESLTSVKNKEYIWK